MANLYGVAFSTSDPRTYTSLAPTFLTFKDLRDGSDLAKPTITQVSTTGIYAFTFSPSFGVYFLLDGITTNSSSDRYVYGILDPVQQVDRQIDAFSTSFLASNSSLFAVGASNNALGVTNVAIGTTLTGFGTSIYAQSASVYAIAVSLYAQGSSLAFNISDLQAKVGTTASTFGNSFSDPVTLYGYLKRTQEFLEGDAEFTKTIGQWDIRSRGGSLLITKNLNNTATAVTKT